METKWTPTPWHVEQGSAPVYGSNGTLVCDGIGIGAGSTHITTCYSGKRGMADAERIVACVNACANFEDPAEAIRLLGIEAAKANTVDALRAQVDELAAALYESTRCLEFVLVGEDHHPSRWLIQGNALRAASVAASRAALAKVRQS